MRTEGDIATAVPSAAFWLFPAAIAMAAAAALLTANGALVDEGSDAVAATSVYPAPAVVTVKELNVATPLAAFVVVVPPSVPLGLRDSETAAIEDVTALP